MSATKSVVSLLIGIAIDQGKIYSIEDKVLDYFPDYSVKRGEKTIYDVTIKHLLTMQEHLLIILLVRLVKSHEWECLTQSRA